MEYTNRRETQFVNIMDWMFALGLSGTELFIYAIIYGYSNGNDGCFWGSQKKLAERLCVSRQSVFLALKALTDKGFIERSEKINPYTQTYQYTVTDKRTIEKRELQVDEDISSPCQDQEGEEISSCQKTRHGENISPCKETLQGEEISPRHKMLQGEEISPCKESLQGGVKKVYRGCKKSLHNIKDYNKKDNKAIANEAVASSATPVEKPLEENQEDETQALLEKCSPELQEAMKKFIEYRKYINAPMTPYGIEALVEMLLNELASDEERIKAIRTSILNNWREVYTNNRNATPIASQKETSVAVSEKPFERGWIPQEVVDKAKELVKTGKWKGALGFLDAIRRSTPPNDIELQKEALKRYQTELATKSEERSYQQCTNF